MQVEIFDLRWSFELLTVMHRFWRVQIRQFDRIREVSLGSFWQMQGIRRLHLFLLMKSHNYSLLLLLSIISSISPLTRSALNPFSSYCSYNSKPKPMLYFIRHAESEFNAVADLMEKKYGEDDFYDAEEYIQEKFDRKYLDVEITQEGRQHALEAREKMKDVEVDLIIVSPMRRALSTCSIIFEGHKSKAPIIVEPSFREIMESSNDIGSRLEESIQLFPTFNFDHINDKEAWYVYTLHNEKDRQWALSELKGLQGKERSQKAIECCLKIEKESWAERRSNIAFEQALKVRVLPDYNEQLKVLENYSKQYPRIAVVAHSECIKRYAGYKIKNCEIFPMETSSLKLAQQ